MTNTELGNVKTELIRGLPLYSKFNGKALSDSMFPLIDINDEVIIQKIPIDELKIGDVILFNKAGDQRTYLHRVKQIDTIKKKFITKGDNLLKFDIKINFEQYLGKAIALLKDGREYQINSTLLNFFGYSISNRLPRKAGLSRRVFLLEMLVKKLFKKLLFKIL